MTRKVIQLNPTTLAITLPKKWVTKVQIKKGDELNIEETDKHELLVGGKRREQDRYISIELKDTKENPIRSYIAALYRMGYTEININFQKKETFKQLQFSIESFYGLDIFDITENSCILRSVFSMDNINIKSHILKTVHIINTMFDIVTADISKNLYSNDSQIFQFARNCHKQRDLIHRVITLQNITDLRTFPYYQISINLSSIAKTIRILYQTLKTTDTFPDDLKSFKQVKILFQKLFISIKDDFNFEMHEEEIQLTEKINSQLDKKKDTILNAYCLRMLLFIQNCNAPLAMINIAKG